MRLIKYFFLFIFVISSLAVKSKELSYAAKNFRSNIQSFLREEGFSPSIDKDGSLCFKKEGKDFWIDITGDKTFYVTLHREPLGCKDANPTYVLKAINDVNTNVRAIKCCFQGEYVSLGIETYCYVPEDFKYVFYTYLNILDFGVSELEEAYSKYDTSSNKMGYGNRNSNSNSNTSSSSHTGSRSRNPIYINGPILETKYHKWWATQLELNSSNTIVQLAVVPKIESSVVWSTQDEYIEDCDTGKKYYITGSSLGLEPNHTTLHSKEIKSFTHTYPALPLSVKRINIWSGSDYYVKNLQIR